FPFFLTGYFLTKKHFVFLKKPTMRIITLSIVIIMFVLIYTLPDFNSGWLLASKSYSHLGLPNAGVLARLLVYFTSSLMVMSLFSWVPSIKFSFTYYGDRTLYIFFLYFCSFIHCMILNLVCYLLHNHIVILEYQMLVCLHGY